MPEDAKPTQLDSAIERLGDKDSYMQVLVGLAGQVKLDEKARHVVFGQVLGQMSAEVARKAARPWQIFTMVLLVALLITIWAFSQSQFAMQMQMFIAQAGGS
jgi:hypothetical protein